MALATAELTLITFILKDLGVPLLRTPTLFCDNLSALHMSINPVFHARTTHVEMDDHFVREKVAQGLLVTKFVASSQQLADLFTKPLPKDAFLKFISNLGLRCSPSLKGSNGNIKLELVTD